MVLSGTLHVVRDDLWGDRAILSQLRAGDLFAEVYALLGEPLQVTVEARESSQVLFFSVRRMREDVPQLGERLELVLARKNLALNRKLGYLTLPTTREKALAYLSDESRRQGSGTFSIPFDRQELADYLKQQVSAELPDAVVNGEGDIPHVVNLSMPGCKSEVMLHVLEGDEVYISSGSACSKGKQSGVLKALGLPKARTDSALRVSFAPFNTREDVDAFVAAVKKGAKMFRR